MKRLILVALILAGVISTKAQMFSTYEDFRSLSRANLEVFKRMVNAKGFEQTDRVSYMNKKSRELIIRDSYGLTLVVNSPTKHDNILKSFKKNGFKFVTSYDEENPFKGNGDLIYSFNYFRDSSRILEGKIQTYEDKSYLYFIRFYGL